MTYHGEPISSRAEAVGVTTWLWAGHQGLHCGPDQPSAEVVPTGHLWGWGPGVRVHLREDPIAPTRGILVRDGAATGRSLTTLATSSGADLPTIVSDRTRFLRCASVEDQQRFEAIQLEVLVVTAPTRAVLIADRRG